VDFKIVGRLFFFYDYFVEKWVVKIIDSVIRIWIKVEILFFLLGFFFVVTITAVITLFLIFAVSAVLAVAILLPLPLERLFVLGALALSQLNIHWSFYRDLLKILGLTFCHQFGLSWRNSLGSLNDCDLLNTFFYRN
jgi:hypothetical protein